MRLHRLFVSIATILCLYINSSAQTKTIDIIEGGVCVGVCIDPKASKQTRTAQVTFSHQFSEKDGFGFTRNGWYPTAGVSLSINDYSHLKTNDGRLFGDYISTSFHTSQYLYKHNNFGLKYVLENGGVFATTPYDPDRNPFSTIGGHMQVYAHAGLMMTFYKGNDRVISIGPTFTHHSNSGIHQPNHGCNTVSIEVKIGQERNYQREPYISKVSTDEVYLKPTYLNLSIGAGITDIGTPTDHDMYILPDIAMAYMYQPSPRNAIGPGIDIYLDPNNKSIGNNIGLCIQGDEWIGEQIAVRLAVGTYISGPMTEKFRLYEKIGVNFCLANRHSKVVPYLGWAVKGNYFHAECLQAVFGVLI